MRPYVSWCWPRTLRGRLALVALTTAALLMVILTAVFNTVVRSRLQHRADDELHTRAAAVAATIDTSGPRVRVLETPGEELLDTNVWIYDGGRLLEKPPSAAAGQLTHAADQLAARTGRRCVTVQAHGPVRLCSLPVPDGKSDASVVTALDLSPYSSSADALLVASLTLDAVMLACTYALTRLAVGRALRPVRAMTEHAAQWSAVTSEERFASVERPTELTQLGGSLDALLDRIRALLRHEQQLTRELSHELRNPLARIIAELDWWQARPRSATDTRATHDNIADAARSMRTICDTLLDDARDSAATTRGVSDVPTVLRRLADRVDSSAEVEVVVTVRDPGLSVGVPDTLLERIAATRCSTTPCDTHARGWRSGRTPVRAASASTSRTTAPACRFRSRRSSSSRGAAPGPGTDTTERAWGCRCRVAWPVPSAARCTTMSSTPRARAS